MKTKISSLTVNNMTEDILERFKAIQDVARTSMEAGIRLGKKSTNRALLEGLKKYAVHLKGCSSLTPAGCNCGLEDLIARAEGEK